MGLRFACVATLVAAWLEGCSSARPPAASSGGSDGGVPEAGAAAGPYDGAPVEDAGSPDVVGDDSCAAPCSGLCSQGHCLVTLAEVAQPTDIAVDDASVYFTSCPDGGGGAALSVPLAGGTVVTLASGSRCPASIALADTNLYVAGLEGGDVARVPRSGGALTTIAPGTDPATGLAVDDANAYLTTAGGVLWKVPLAGGGAAMLGTCSTGCARPIVHAGILYWGDPGAGTIRDTPVAGGAVATLTSGLEAVTSLGISGAALYFADGYLLAAVPLAGGTAMSVGLPTGAPVGALAVDEARAYYTSWGSTGAIPFDQSQPTRIADEQGDPNAIAVDSTSVYWTDSDEWPARGCCGRVMKLTPK